MTRVIFLWHNDLLQASAHHLSRQALIDLMREHFGATVLPEKYNPQFSGKVHECIEVTDSGALTWHTAPAVAEAKLLAVD